MRSALLVTALFTSMSAVPLLAQQQDRIIGRQTQRPPLHGKSWIALTGKPLGATAGAKDFAATLGDADAGIPAVGLRTLATTAT
jgi:hypothetical protein